MTVKELSAARIGIDIGRVLMCPTSEHDGPDTSFLSGDLEQALAIPAADHALEVIRNLVEATSGNVWLVSKAGKRIQTRTRQWLAHHRFFADVGMSPTHLHFCFKRHEKGPIARRLQLSHFVDDRTDVLQHMRGVVPQLLLFGVQDRPAPAWAKHVKNWQEIRDYFRGGEPSELQKIG